MKAIKLLTIAALALAFTGCKDNDTSWDGSTSWDDNGYGWNSKDGVTVQMGETSVEVVESQGLFNIPINVTGERDGYIQVTVEVIEAAASADVEPAMADVHYFVTTPTVNINPESNVGNIEIRTNDNRGLDPTRTFYVKIVSTKGRAVIGGMNETLVTITDKGSSPAVNELAGQWVIAGIRYNFETEELNEEYFEEVSMRMTDATTRTFALGTIPLNNVASTLTLVYDYDDEEKYGELVMPASCPYGTMNGITFTLSNSSEVKGKWNSTYTSVTFGDSQSAWYVEGNGKNYDLMGYFTITRVAD